MFDLVPSVLAFALAATITPGPNNVMVMASGVNFGYWRTVPHMLGISVGFPLMLVAVGAGLGAVLQNHPDVQRALTYIGAAYLLWLAWKIVVSAAPVAGATVGRPFGFFQAAAFQWVNPKAWMMSLGAVTAFTSADRDFALDLSIITISFAVFVYPCVSIWTLFGGAIGRLLRQPRAHEPSSTSASHSCWSRRFSGLWYCRSSKGRVAIFGSSGNRLINRTLLRDPHHRS